QLYTQLKQDFFSKSPNLANCATLLAKAKLALAQSRSFLVVLPKDIPSAQQEMILARDILEIGALHAIHSHDIPSFERYYAQLSTYYIDYASALPASPRHLMLNGLYLLSLLAQNRIAEFHASLELIPIEHHTNNPYIRHAVLLEQALMEGAYNRVWHAREDVPAGECVYFVDLLMGTIRNEIAACAERSFDHLKLSDVGVLLMFASGGGADQQVREFCASRGWTVGKDGLVRFAAGELVDTALEAELVMKDVLGYAKELERIV
ncbi:SAC3/GANP/Nin1/mts3/eIF-3 p25 family-domain-containing protein, partial [Catenaria anguillulae PL171]